jgi:hypothetical protein
VTARLDAAGGRLIRSRKETTPGPAKDSPGNP